eukprot:scaffold2318_cov363-Pavlova_lutheri.AAC.12
MGSSPRGNGLLHHCRTSVRFRPRPFTFHFILGTASGASPPFNDRLPLPQASTRAADPWQVHLCAFLGGLTPYRPRRMFFHGLYLGAIRMVNFGPRPVRRRRSHPRWIRVSEGIKGTRPPRRRRV